MRVGRVVAGWPETDKGGTPPNANSLTEVDRTSFRALAMELYKQYLSFYDASILEVLTASLVMYYNDAKYKWAKMDREDVLLLLISIEAAACRVGVSKHDLSNWSTTLRNRWIVDNLPWLPIEQQAETATKDDHEIRIDTYSFHDVLTQQATPINGDVGKTTASN
uniref:Uncharacterized protein n=1 Tax=Globisporangium ultimum (strain ATCC 200006 / CBS 805.95 / DAOM BR144) TaxID=431595 RepID=K3WS33_GLOUD